MADTQIISETPMNVYQLRKEIEKIKKRGDDLNFRAGKTEEYLLQTASEIKNAEELFDRIIKLNIPRLREQHVHKIIDVMPTTANELKTVVQGYTITLNNESVKKIVDAISEFLEKK